MVADYVPPMTPTRASGTPFRPRRPLIVRLRNWVGDVTLAVPTLRRLDSAGFDLQLIGKGWARDLLAGHGWAVHALPKTMSERIALLRRLKAQAQAADAGFNRRLNALCLPDSFSSALEFRLAGLRTLGHAHEGRSPLLARALPLPRTLHALQVYWQMGDALLGAAAPLPEAIGLRVSDAHREAARALSNAHRIAPGSLYICPFAGGTWAQQDKTWPAFPAFAAQVLPGFGRRVVVCPGPGEEAVAQQHFGSATVLNGVGLGTYAALLQNAALMVANDTGPGHMAAAVGTPLVSVLGPSDAALWRAWGPAVQLVQGAGGWPETAAVTQAVQRALAPHA
jgi:ADP-heptose:LPS heptosyltransferase